MNLQDLQTIDSFNQQCDEVARKVDILIKFIKECLKISQESKEGEELMVKATQKAIEKFDIYIFIDFVEEEQAKELLEVICAALSIYSKKEYEYFSSQLESYQSICQGRLAYLNEMANNLVQNKYQLIFPPPQEEVKIPKEDFEVPFKPIKIVKSIKK